MIRLSRPTRNEPLAIARVALSLFFAVCAGTWVQAQPIQTQTSSQPAGKGLIPVRMPGEFERQKAIMLSVTDWMPHHFDILTDLVRHTAGHIELLIFYEDNQQLTQVVRHLAAAGVAGDHVSFSPMELDTIWLRDFAPRIAESPHGPVSLDFFYEGSRPQDDNFPRRWAEVSRIRLRTVRWTIQGGNLLFNGQGLGVTSERIFQDNAIQFPTQFRPRNPAEEARRMVRDEFKRACNLSQLVVLEPLQREITRHVDMFMTFVSPDHALVGWLHPSRDPVNAGILNRNAQRLAQVRVDNKPLKVSRIEFPTPNNQQWSSFTNVILANDLVLLPTFQSDPPALVAAAKRVYQQALPGSTVKTVNLDSMKALQGSLHCLSMPLPDFAPWPQTRYQYNELRQQLPPDRSLNSGGP
ncbi:MAG: agmatine deiminase family protein [Planctomycetota bacterium]